jgi:FAD:protein FMN transferase
MTAETILTSTVAAPNPADAGAMATAFSVLTPAESRRVAASMPGVDYLIVTNTGERIASAAWSKLAARPPIRPPVAFLHAVAAPADSHSQG